MECTLCGKVGRQSIMSIANRLAHKENALTLRHCKLVLSTTFWQYRDGSPLGSEYKTLQEQETFFCMTKIWGYYPSKGCCRKEIKGLENSVSQLHFVSNWMTLHTIYHQQIDIMQQSKAWLDCTLFSFKAEWDLISSIELWQELISLNHPTPLASNEATFRNMQANIPIDSACSWSLNQMIFFLQTELLLLKSE